MSTKAVRLSIVTDPVDDGLCGSQCVFLAARLGETVCELTAPLWLPLNGRDFGWTRTESCLAATAQQALDDAVLEAAESACASGVWNGVRAAVNARRSATREGGS